ncbi:MAG: pyrroloquinoline quinone-dependent dehydrogenase [Deltaproteobacteria bacterium]|nr:pyrroloquinoline quinone-dependent dehydrogenase [Deltaproteobacteria bacterium]
MNVRNLLRAILLGAIALSTGCNSGTDEVEDVGWPSYAGDPGSSKYSPASQIHRENALEIEEAWTFVSPDSSKMKVRLHTGPKLHHVNSFVFQTTPLMIDGVLYGSTSFSQVFALDAATGEPIWISDQKSYRQGMRTSFLYPKHRGVTYWRDSDGNRDDERIFIPTVDAYLVALDARTGRPIAGFGTRGRIDLLAGLRRTNVLRNHDFFQTSPAALYDDILIVGSSVTDVPTSPNGVPGDVRGFSARTGELLWTFHTVPAAGEPGVETWEDESWRKAGASNAWGPLSVDPELGFVYVPTGTPTNDHYGGHRPGDNLYADSLLCLDARTGRLVWHQQLVHHGLWDYDVAAPPNLVDLEVEGEHVRAVAQVTKQGFTFVFDRTTGEPIWPIEDRPVPASTVPGEVASPTQRYPTRPPAFERQLALEEDLLQFTPELAAENLAIFRKYTSAPLFTPPSLEGVLTFPGTVGGANWHGAAFDPDAGTLFVTSIAVPAVFSAIEGKKLNRDFRYVGALQIPMGARGLPLFKPPYGSVTAIDLNSGTILWQVPNGDGPRDHPLLADLKLPRMGSAGSACALATDSLLFVTGGSDFWNPNRGEPSLGMYRKDTGALVARYELPAKIRGCPMTYIWQGRQYVVFAMGDPGYRPRLMALALPRKAD